MIGKNISIKNYYWMLAYAFNSINDVDKTKISAETFDNIYELFSFIYVMELNKQVKRGLNKNYKSIEEESSDIRGKININESVKRMSFINKKLYIEYDDYTVDSYLNRIVKTAGKYLLKSRKIKNNKYISELHKSIKYLNDVSEVNPKQIKWNTIRYDRNNSSYRMIINLSYFILNGLLSTKEDGNYVFNDYLDDRKMYRLYEKFILGYYQYHYADLLVTSSPSIDWIVDNKKMLPKMFSDIVLFDKKKKRKLIIDAKYYSSALTEHEFYNRETFRSNNLYQIFTYVKNEDKEKDGSVSGMLLYAKTDYNDNIDEEYNMDGNIIKVSNLDLSKDFSVVQERLDGIVDWFMTEK